MKVPVNASFPEKVKFALDKTKPGYSAQKKMAPSNRQKKPAIKYETCMLSAVLICLYPKSTEWHICFMKRTKDNTVHSGQISFPGGKYEQTDILIQETAIREAQEEMNIACSGKDIVGILSSLYVPPSNFLIYPVVVCLPKAPEFKPNPFEVDAIIEVKLSDIFNDQAKKIKKIDRGEIQFDIPYYKIDSHQIWGATAMILSELEQMLKKYNLV